MTTSHDLTEELTSVRASYDAVADEYVRLWREEGMADVTRPSWLHSALLTFAAEVRGRGPVIDVGCGPGQVTAYLHRQGLDVHGVDLSPRMIEHARDLHPECRFEVASATDLDLGTGSYGGILAWWSLFNLPRDVLPRVLSSFATALVPGGRFIMATHIGDESVTRTRAYGDVPVRWTTHLWRPERLIDLVTEAGLTLEAELRLSPGEDHGDAVILMARR